MIDQERLQRLDTLTLSSGYHKYFYEGFCAMEAVAWLAGEPHSDAPVCACPVISAFIRVWNDLIQDDETRTKYIRPLLVKLIGTRSTQEVEDRRTFMIIDWEIRDLTSSMLEQLDQNRYGNLIQKLRSLPEVLDRASERVAHEVMQCVIEATRSADWAANRYWDANYLSAAYAIAAVDDPKFEQSCHRSQQNLIHRLCAIQ